MSAADLSGDIPAVMDVTLQSYPLLRRGKVRNLFDCGDYLLIVVTDRISAFDVVLPSPIPGKGRVLTAISRLWFDLMRHIVPNHLIADRSLEDLDLNEAERRSLDGRSMLVQRAERIDIECVVRGYLAGSGWKEYRQHGTLASESLPDGLSRGSRLPAPTFTPAIKNDAGHDENISRQDLRDQIGDELATKLEATSLALYAFATDYAAKAGFIVADTKFEFGFVDGELTLIDEALTTESSRFWDVSDTAEGQEPPSFDKQPVRDWLESTGWNKEPPGPMLPDAIVKDTVQRYTAVYERLAAVPHQEDQ